uniref:Ras related dexamethasone induced 1 n=1 Tax=Callorhinchus milii TaxID=7868 RepID=A0A4W3JFW6_CALMI
TLQKQSLIAQDFVLEVNATTRHRWSFLLGKGTPERERGEGVWGRRGDAEVDSETAFVLMSDVLPSITGDVFILVFSLDNRDSFEEVQRLKQQIMETKSCLKNKTKENIDVPIVICGNKGDRDFYREVQREEVQQLVEGDKKCAYFEISAKRNTSLDEMFQALFTMAKLPSEMSPDLHRKVSVQYCDILHRKSFRSRKLKDEDAYGVVAPFARRPSVHSDLMYIKEKAIGGSHSRDKERCAIS